MATTSTRSRRPSRSRAAPALALVAALLGAVLGPVLLLAVLVGPGSRRRCVAAGGGSGSVTVLGPGRGAQVGATEYGGPGDPSSGTVGASGVDLSTHPDSFAELGGTTVATATAMGGLPFQAPLRVTWGRRSAIAYKRDIGLGGGPIDGRPRAIDLWWRLAGALGIPYRDGRWSGTVRVTAPPAAGAGSVLGEAVQAVAPVDRPKPGSGSAGAGCGPSDGGPPVPVAPGDRARLLSDGRAAAPAGAPAAVRQMIAAGNQIVGKPYMWGGGHGIPLDEIAPSYDCSSSVEHLMWGGGLEPASFGSDSGGLESFGAPGTGRWVTLYASDEHVFMYVAGLRWDTHDAAGAGDGSTGIGWHPLVRGADGFVARHPVGL